MKDLDILWRRVAAYLLDCMLIFLFAVALGLIVFSISRAFGIGLIQSPIIGQLIGFFTLTFPAILYFAVTETSWHQASFGKRILKLKVQTLGGGRATFVNCFARAVILLLPWEIAHTAIWYSAPQPFIDTPSTASLAVMIGAQVMIVIYLIVALFTPKQSLAERFLELEIVRR